jgi:hypothetical protein
MKAIIVSLLALTLNQTCALITFGQVTINEFLNSANSDPEVLTFSDKITYLNNKPYRLSPIREVQLRTQNRELLPTQQEFGVRVSPANPFELRRHNEYFKEYNSALSFEKEFALKDALSVRYLTVIEFVYFADLSNQAATSSKNLADQIAILEKQSGSHYFDAEDFVDLKLDQLDFQVEQEEIQFELSNQLHRIARTYPQAHQQTIEWSFLKLISPEGIKAVIDSLEQLSIKTSWVAYQEQKIRLAQSQYKLEKNNFNIGFIQSSYDNRRVNQDRNPISISAGLTLPITNPNKGDMARRKLDIIEAEYDFKEETSEAETDKQILSDKVRSLVDRLDNLEKRMRELRESDLPITLSSIRGGDPIVIIQFTQNLDKLNVLSLKVKRELFISYVEYLAFTDHLQKTPLVNFLSPSLEQLAK